MGLLTVLVVKKEATHTVGVEFGSKITQVAGKDIKFQVWDTGTLLEVLGPPCAVGKNLTGGWNSWTGEISARTAPYRLQSFSSSASRSVTRSYYRGSAGAILVYDITRLGSFFSSK